MAVGHDFGLTRIVACMVMHASPTTIVVIAITAIRNANLPIQVVSSNVSQSKNRGVQTCNRAPLDHILKRS